MGFLKFLKREKKQVATELDLPPAPPQLAGFEELPKLPDFPDFSDENTLDKDQLPPLDFPDESKMPEFPSFPEYQEEPIPTEPVSPRDKPVESPPLFGSTLIMPQFESESEQVQTTQEASDYAPSEEYPKIERRLFSRERQALRERPSGKTIYVRADNFKATLGSINALRNDLKKSEEALLKLENIKIARDKSFERVKSSLDDLQKKLIFIDKTIFKGE